MSTSNSGGSASHSTNPTTAKHQLVSPEGFLRPVEGLPEGVTKLVIYVGGDDGRDTKEKLEAILRVCEEINSVRGCTELSTLRSMIEVSSKRVKYLVFNYRKGRTFTFIATDRTYKKSVQEEEYYEVSYDLFMGKLRWAEEALLFQRHLDEVFGK